MITLLRTSGGSIFRSFSHNYNYTLLAITRQDPENWLTSICPLYKRY